jgi:hypothetical protein
MKLSLFWPDDGISLRAVSLSLPYSKQLHNSTVTAADTGACGLVWQLAFRISWRCLLLHRPNVVSGELSASPFCTYCFRDPSGPRTMLHTLIREGKFLNWGHCSRRFGCGITLRRVNTFTARFVSRNEMFFVLDIKQRCGQEELKKKRCKLSVIYVKFFRSNYARSFSQIAWNQIFKPMVPRAIILFSLHIFRRQALLSSTLFFWYVTPCGLAGR